MFDYFGKFSSNAHHVCCEDSPTKGLHNLFLFRWPWPSLTINCVSKLTNALICTWIIIYRKIFKLWHSNLAWRLTYAWDVYILMVVSMTWLDLDARSQWIGRGKNQLWIIWTTKQAIQIKLAATVGHDKFCFSLKSSVPVVLNYGHASVSCTDGLVSQCLLSERTLVSRQKT